MIRAPEWLVRRLARFADRTMARRPPDFIIGGAGDPYLKRWYVVRTALGGLYVHEYWRDDDDRALHDHPWPSLSIMTRGALLEMFAPKGRDPSDPEQHRLRLVKRRGVVLRGSRFAHRLIVPDNLKGPNRRWRPVTLFFFGPRIRRWGFWCPQGWRHWKDFVRPDDRGAVGRGCGD